MGKHQQKSLTLSDETQGQVVDPMFALSVHHQDFGADVGIWKRAATKDRGYLESSGVESSVIDDLVEAEV